MWKATLGAILLAATMAIPAGADPDNPEPECDCADCFAGYWFSVDETTNELKGIVQVTATSDGGVFVTWIYAPKIKGNAVSPNITHGVGKVKNCVLAVAWGSPDSVVAVSIYEHRKNKDGHIRVVGEGEVWRRAIPPTKTVSIGGV